mgnify:CR=1 FL=1
MGILVRWVLFFGCLILLLGCESNGSDSESSADVENGGTAMSTSSGS